MTWVALLRAVNLGPRNRVPMPELRALLEQAGHAAVRTYIASGNVLFESKGHSREALTHGLERLIRDAFGVRTSAILRTADELAAVVARHPFGADTSGTHVCFLAAEPDADAAARLARAERGDDRAELAGTHVYVLYPNGVQRSRLGAATVERLLGVPGTVRSWRTVEKLAELAGP